MLVFRSGVWKTIPVIFSDPMFTEGHRREAAAIIASRVEKGGSLVSATAEAEKTLYLRLYGGLVSSASGTLVMRK